MWADDTHWLDRPTQDVLAFVARRVGSDSVGLLLAARDDGSEPLRAAQLPEVRLGPLGDDDATALLTERAPWLDPPGRRRVLAAARGNPLGLVELASEPAALQLDVVGSAGRLPLPDRLERSFIARLPELPQPIRRLLLARAADGGLSLAELSLVSTCSPLPTPR